MPEIHISSPDNNNSHLEKELRKFKRLCDKAGRPAAVRKKMYHIKPTAQRKRQAASAKKRWEKKLQKEEESIIRMLRSRLYQKSRKTPTLPTENNTENKDVSTS